MIATFICWRDACAEEAAAPNTPVVPTSPALHEIGWVLGENEDIVTIGMEAESDGIAPGRWRLHIPKRNIVQRIDFEVPKLVPRARARKRAKAKVSEPQV